MSLLKHSTRNEKIKEDKKIISELPYFITLVTLLATSGFGPYTIFNKIREIDILPKTRLEAEKILKRIELLGIDPLTAMTHLKNKPKSQTLQEFLSGYVSAIQGGGDVINYLKNKMNNAFDVYEAAQKEVVEKAKALVESYMTAQIVILAVYIIITATTTQQNYEIEPLYIMIILPPIVTALFLFMVNKINHSKVKEVDWKKILIFGIPGVMLTSVLILTNMIPGYNAYVLAGALIAMSIWPFVKFQKMYSFSLAAENAMPQILRDIAEARKAGLGPEKCMIKACKRKDFGMFNSAINTVASRLEWGMSLENIYQTIRKEIKNFQILISFRILFEIITSGGGNAHTLDSLAKIEEKIQTIEKTKREMLKPYIMIGFMLVGITGFTTLLVIDSLTSINIQAETSEFKKVELEKQTAERFELLSIAIVSQAWLAGLFLGKITTGSYSGGFKFSILLIMVSLVTILLIQNQIFDMESIFG